MGSLTASVRGAIHQANHSLRQRMLQAVPLSVTPSHFYNEMISERHREILREAKELGARSTSYHSTITFDYLDQEITVDMEECGIVPVQLTANHQKIHWDWLFAKELADWADQCIEINDKFCRGEHVLQMLEESCNTIKQIRYFLPGLATLASIGGERELAKDLAASPVVRNAPGLPFGARQAIADYNALIAQSSLLSENRTRRRINVKYVTRAEAPWIKVEPTDDEV